jgi:hypothetical protein
MMYRVRVARCIRGEYRMLPDRIDPRGLKGGVPKGGGVKILASSAPLNPDGTMKRALLVEEKSRAWAIDKEIEELEEERRVAKEEYGGAMASPTSANRDGDWNM